jgi:hypothetical protein
MKWWFISKTYLLPFLLLLSRTHVNYIKGDKSFVFTYLNRKGTDTNKAGFGFYNGSAKTANLFAGGIQMQVLNSSIYEMTIPLIRRVSDHWMNEYLLR